MKPTSRNQQFAQSGIAVLTMILLVVILLAVIGSVVAYSRGSPTSPADQTAKLMAASIVDQGNTLKDGFDLMMAKGTDIDTITFNLTATTGLFAGTTGGAVDQSPSADSVSAATQWFYAKGGTNAKGVKITGVGTAGSSYALLLPNVKDSVCKQINQSLHNVDGASGIPASTKATPAATARVIDAQLDLSSTTTVGLLDIYGTDISGAEIDGWYMGCVTTTTGADKNVYFNVIKPI